MQEYIEIEGGIALKGEVKVCGAKNAVLPMLIASLLTAEEVIYTNVPRLSDVNSTLRLLEHFGAETSYQNDQVQVKTSKLIATEASYSLVKSMRASFWVLGPMLARGGAARVALPGGDIIGARPVDLHLEALSKMGADIQVKHGVVYATANAGLKPADISLRFASVGATHQVLLAASLTPGKTILRGAAREPEVVALANMLNSMGAKIHGAGESHIEIEGREILDGCAVELIGDRIEAATYVLATALTGGDVLVSGFDPKFFGSFLDILDQMKVGVELVANGVRISAPNKMQAVSVTTAPFPGFATDIQAPLMAALTLAEGVSEIQEMIFDGRFAHVGELCRMGADISVDGRKAIIKGVKNLSGAPVEGNDIRAAAALVIAALAAEGFSQIHEPQHIRRGYSQIEDKLRALGARIGLRQKDPEDFLLMGC